MMLRQAAKYLKYIIISRHRAGHGIHSPFVFSLINRLFRNKTDHTIVSTVEKVRKRLRSDYRYIYVTDLGSGSGKHKNNSILESASKGGSIRSQPDHWFRNFPRSTSMVDWAKAA